jgi:hypothetical protein
MQPYVYRLADEWVPLEQVVATKTLRLSQLPESVKCRLQQQLRLAPPPPAHRPKQARKQKWVEPPSHFLTPDEVAAAEQERSLPTAAFLSLSAPSRPVSGELFRRPAPADQFT